MKFFINSIYRGTEGEGVLIGSPQVFLRYQGCAIGCVNCDSRYTWRFNQGEMTLAQVLKGLEAESLKSSPPLKRLLITGGDPLNPLFEEGLIALIQNLKKEAYWIGLEAAGNRLSDRVFDLVDFINFDIKTPSTGVTTPKENLKRLRQQYHNKFQVKSVVQDQADFDYLYDLYQEVAPIDFSWCLTPAFNPQESFPAKRVEEIVDWNQSKGGPFRVIIQQHKVLYGPNKENV